MSLRATVRVAVVASVVLPWFLAHSDVAALSVVPPRHLAELAEASDAVVFARAGESRVRRARRAQTDLPYTHTEFTVLRSIDGAHRAGESVEVQVPGGSFDGLEWKIPGMPRFENGGDYLLCLARKREGDPLFITAMFSYGLLREVEATTSGGESRRLLVPVEETLEAHAVDRPDGVETESIGAYDAEALLDHLTLVLRGEVQWSAAALLDDSYEIESGHDHEVQPELEIDDGGAQGGGAAVPAGCFYFSSNGVNWRQPNLRGGSRLTIYGNSPGDPSMTFGGYHLVQEALDLWMNVSPTGCNMLFGGSRVTAPGCGGQANFILFDDPCSDIADLQGCGGTLAFGGGAGGGTHSFDGTSWITMHNWFVVMNNGVGCVGTGGYRILLGHELGHGMGFGHSQDSGALMWGSCCRDINSTDRTCVRYTYPPPNDANDRPQPDAGPDRQLPLAGNRGILTGTVSDDGLPAGRGVTTRWVHLHGPAEAEFADAGSLSTVVTFSASGRYLLGLVADDGELLRMDQVFLDVEVSGGRPTRIFQQGVDGYEGTIDTMIVEASPGSIQSSAPELGVDGDDPSGSGDATQVLIEFADIFGEGVGQILPGSPIRSARLEISSVDPGTGAEVYRMRRAWDPLDNWSSYGPGGIEVGVDTESQPDVVIDALGGGTIAVDVTESVAAWSAAPCTQHGWALLPYGGNGWDFFSSEGAAPPRLVVQLAPLVDDPLIGIGEDWDFFRGSRAPSASWNQPGFVPSAAAGWETGPSGFGYGDDDDLTILEDMAGSYSSVFLRKEFEVGTVATALRLRIDYDDGFIAYLNGEEVARSASLAPAGAPVEWNDLASGQREAGEFEIHEIDPSLLVEGTNTLAIQVHNVTLDSSDLSLRPELIADHAFIRGGAEWRYLTGDRPLPLDWTDPDFDDSSWAVGETGIGYGDDDDVTVLEGMRGNYQAIFCRKEFEIVSLDDIEVLAFEVRYDDGCTVFVNDIEIARVNVGPGDVTASLPALEGRESFTETVLIPRSALVEGRNVIAVSVHNVTIDSSDLSFDPLLFPGGLGCRGGFVRGDASADGIVEVSDAVTLLLHLFGGLGDLLCDDSADIDDDGSLNTTDAVLLLVYLFQGGERPADPGPRDCGVDPTPDAFADCPEDTCQI